MKRSDFTGAVVVFLMITMVVAMWKGEPDAATAVGIVALIILEMAKL